MPDIEDGFLPFLLATAAPRLDDALPFQTNCQYLGRHRAVFHPQARSDIRERHLCRKKPNRPSMTSRISRNRPGASLSRRPESRTGGTNRIRTACAVPVGLGSASAGHQQHDNGQAQNLICDRALPVNDFGRPICCTPTDPDAHKVAQRGSNLHRDIHCKIVIGQRTCHFPLPHQVTSSGLSPASPPSSIGTLCPTLAQAQAPLRTPKSQSPPRRLPTAMLAPARSVSHRTTGNLPGRFCPV